MNPHDEASASGPDSQMHFLRMMGGGGGGSSSSNPAPAPAPPPPSAPIAPVDVRLQEKECTIQGTKITLHVADPGASPNEINPVIVLDRDEAAFKAWVDIILQALAEKATTIADIKKAWKIGGGGEIDVDVKRV